MSRFVFLNFYEACSIKGGATPARLTTLIIEIKNATISITIFVKCFHCYAQCRYPECLDAFIATSVIYSRKLFVTLTTR